MSKVNVRFAPSPTGALHIGGVRTALFNYLFAKANKGNFILRIEDTDQTRFVNGAEEYIKSSLEWLGIRADEGPDTGGPNGPYRQSERKTHYQKYVDQLLADGNAYYAFDTPQELEDMRDRLKSKRILNPQYDTLTRSSMRNSLTLPADEVATLIRDKVPYVVRVKVPEKEEIRLQDLIRGWVKVNTDVMDDKVLIKSDGMPTYHLANVVDDHLMQITHVIRGEEWLPSAPLHVLLYQMLGFDPPQFAHLPLILKPDGNGKLSKRAADKAGIPIFPLNWTNPETGETSLGFKELGFLPEAMLNFLAFLGWNPGTEKELFSHQELIESFKIERINKAGTKFDFEKAKWFNQQYIKATPNPVFADQLTKDLQTHGIQLNASRAHQLVDLFKERITYPHELVTKSLALLTQPSEFDEKVARKKWDEEAENALTFFINEIQSKEAISPAEAKDAFWHTLEREGLNPGKYMQILRLTLTGEGSGPDLMSIISLLGPFESSERIKQSMQWLSDKTKQG